jgi:hypothetical protein
MRKWLAVAMLVGLVGACSSEPGALPKVPDLIRPPGTTTTEVDYSGAPLKGVTRGPTTTITFGPGAATISGTVAAEGGAVPGATIEIERIAGGATATMTLVSAEDGTWQLPQVFGGRYRVRAWRAPDLAQTSWSGVFVGASETKTVDLRLRNVGGLSVVASIAPDPPRLGEDANLVALVTVKIVDDRGVVRATPQVNEPVDLVTSSGWRVLSANPTVTNNSGQADWTLRCRSTGRQQLAVNVGTQTIPLEVASCVDNTPPETTTTAEVSVAP